MGTVMGTDEEREKRLHEFLALMAVFSECASAFAGTVEQTESYDKAYQDLAKAFMFELEGGVNVVQG